jgi:pyruvate/2-oxoglutarate dehydrogenase complex dihydrolipoamide dehydrogenase (E3) component
MGERFDAIVVGAGQSGPALAVKLAQSGSRVAFAERQRFGGTCVNDGCIPTKTLIASAREAHMARRAADYGVVIDGAIRVDMKAVKARKDAVVAKSRDGVESWLRGTDGITVIRGHARFVGPRRLEVAGRELEAERAFLDVGARAALPPVPGLADVPHWTNSSIMDVDFVPPHLVILGGSYIGLEFAQMYRRFGSQVTVIERDPRPIAREDDNVSNEVRRILEAEGIRFHLSADAAAVERRDGGVVVRLGGGEEIAGSHLLVATGRRPNTDDLGAEAGGVKLDKRGYVEVDDELRTSAEGVWALGECNGRGAFTHTSYDDYEIVAANLLGDGGRRVSDRVMAYALFTDPPLGRAGMTEKEARATGRPLLAARMPMARVGRARERGVTDGFLSVVVDAESQQILGAAFLGINADEVIHVIVDAMIARQPWTLIRRAMHIHPTVAELLPTLMEGLKPLR